MSPLAFSMSDELLEYFIPKEHAGQFLAEYGSLYEVARIHLMKSCKALAESARNVCKKFYVSER